MTDLLIVVDMQRDFVSGALGSEQARAIVPAVAARIRQAKAEQTQVAFTLDTHEPDYLNTREGRFLPVPHCIRDTPGWALEPDIAKECAQGMISFAKPTFGSAALCEYVRALAEEKGAADGKGFCVELCGVCTDICVVSNALLLKAALPEADFIVNGALCAGVTPKSTKPRWKPCAPARSRCADKQTPSRGKPREGVFMRYAAGFALTPPGAFSVFTEPFFPWPFPSPPCPGRAAASAALRRSRWRSAAQCGS